MTRSIHDTWGVMELAKRADWADAEIPRAMLVELRRNVRRQFVIRRSERRLRRAGRRHPPPLDLDRLPIVVEDEGDHVFHAVSEEDVRAVLGRLPRGSLDGLQAVRLRLDRVEDDTGLPDPFTGRRRWEIIPGVYASPRYGAYRPSSATIWLHAYVCDPADIAPFALYFKLQGLRTLLHEAAHHFDLTFRVGRSQWDVDDREKEEAWVRRREGAQAYDLIAPYIVERYESQCDELEDWIERHGGVAWSVLAFLDEGVEFTLRRAFVRLVRSVAAGADPDETRVDLARTLHEGGGNELATDALEKVLAEHPDHPRALAVRACIALCGDRDFVRSEADCRRAIDCDPGCVHAWEVLARRAAIQEDWPQAVAACERALSFLPDGDTEHGMYLFETAVEALLLLADVSRLDATIARMRTWGADDVVLFADVCELLALCWREQWDEGLHLASKLRSNRAYDDWSHKIRAARFECANRLGRPHLAGSLAEADLAMGSRPYLRVWADRLRALRG